MAKRKPPATTNGHATPPRVGSYFLSLSLDNVRCFGPKQTLDLTDGHGKPARWTILVGANGTGKTTILRGLVGFELFPGPTGFDGQETYRSRLENGFPETHEGLVRHGSEQAVLGILVGESAGLASPPQRTIAYEQAVRVDGSRMTSGRPVPLPRCHGYGASRRMSRRSLEESLGDDPTATLFSERAELRNAQEWLLQLDYSAVKPSRTQARWKHRQDQITDLLLHILPEITGIRYETAGEVYPRSWVEFATPYGWVPLRQLGDGYQTLIAWVVDLASRMVERYPDSADPLAEPAFVAVDEIDLHLHPVWQRQLMGYLTERFPNTQFVATAHSPLVVQAAANANLAVLRREGDHVVIENDVEDIKSWRIDQILTSDLFGLPSARLPEIEALLVERQRLLTQSKLSPADWKRVREIEAITGDIPTAETAQDLRDQAVIRKTLDRLTQEAQHP